MSSSQGSVELYYPTTPPIFTQPAADHNSNNNASSSFTPVFIVVAMIIALSGVACVVGRLCMTKWHARVARLQEPRPHLHFHRHPIPVKLHLHANANNNHNRLGPNLWEATRHPVANNKTTMMLGPHEEIQFQLDKRSNLKVATNNGGRKPDDQIAQHNGDRRSSQVRFADR
ncbi:uncharacterized protein LOC127263369 [Andrographis paniculata]|uniref:uncharacterized protein LOC127263369 n=1 Tax=Andrographis paniculata TaxID=175694 RepID=UPI0021E99131|nr:uncharacterized protein LOC127263369 [Andrographis paniculata]